MTKLHFQRYCEQRRPGDRAIHPVDCYRFEVKIRDFVAASFDQYDDWVGHVGDYFETLREARKYADGLADILRTERPELIEMVKKETVSVEWVEGSPVRVAKL